MRVAETRSALCTIATGPHRELFEVARPGFERFAALHGYELIVIHDEIATGRPTSWAKVVLLRELLESYDRVVWVDSDAVIVDPTVDIFDGVPRSKPMALVVHHYDGLEVPNAGVMALRSCRWTKRFLRRVWRADQFISHKWWENAAVIDFLGYDVAEPRRSTRRRTLVARRVGYLDLAWNSIALDPSPAPRIVHFPGMTQAQRLVGMQIALEGSPRPRV